MTVYKGYLLLMKRNIRILFLYLALFLTLTLLIQKFMGDDGNLYDSEGVRLNVAVIDQDHTKASRDFTRWIGKHHDLADITSSVHDASQKKSPKESQKEAQKGSPKALQEGTLREELQEEMFYGNLDYILFIPDGFEKKVIKNGKSLSVVEKPGSYQGEFVKAQINQYLSTVRTFTQAGYTTSKAQKLAARQDRLKSDITVIDRNGHQGKTPGYITMFKYLSYLYVAVLCYCLGTVILLMRDSEIQRRTFCSCVSLTRQNIQTLLACMTAGIGLWLISLLLIFGLYGRELAVDPHMPLLLLSSFLMMFDGLAIAFLVGNVAPTAAVINSIVNVTALGMCFLCGVFLPMSMLSAVRPVSRCLPVYWFITAVDLLGDYRTLDAGMRTELYTAFAIQFAMGALIIFIGILIRSGKIQQFRHFVERRIRNMRSKHSDEVTD